MRHLFYILGLLALLYELYCMMYPQKVINFEKKLKAMNAKACNNLERSYTLLSFGYIIWSLFGLLTFQWPLFLLIIILGFLPLKKYAFTLVIDAFLTSVIIWLIIINNYFLHIDISSIVINYLMK